MRFIVFTIVLGALLLSGVAVYMIRTVRHTPIERWHVDPMAVANPPSPNFYRIGPRGVQTAPVDDESPAYGVSPEDLARALDEFALRQRDTRRIAGQPSDLWMTYVQRTPRLKFPDYISVRVIGLDDGRSTVSIFARARFGYGDMGVNRARVLRWLEALSPLESDAPPAQEPSDPADDAEGVADPVEAITDPAAPDPINPNGATQVAEPPEDPRRPAASPPGDGEDTTPVE
ncbi:MAG: DUF1499 domain-containing protein [Pseudomonadota bacterium]